MILNDRKVKLIQIAETLKISKERVGHIVHEYLDMESSVQSGCRESSQSTKNNNELMILSNV
ncbi:Mariner transposase [Caligus rogercresseyi]|uniref:Mariner transposase n=1 Tax=Caligus rogercresseyi TaxID=217165 RepID=A0A7T8GXT2_CALRO|nr:Mariner transposase [Caligus rogercresseyi]